MIKNKLKWSGSFRPGPLGFYKLWYVEYSLRNPITGKMERFRNYDGFKDILSIEGRLVFAEKLIKELTCDIKSGKITCEEIIEYVDYLEYQGISSFRKTKTTSANSIKIYASDFLQYKETEILPRTMQNFAHKMGQINKMTAILQQYRLYLSKYSKI